MLTLIVLFFTSININRFTAMLKYLLLCLLATSQGINARPAHSGPGDLASHILVVTPQAQVHLEPAFKYDAVVPNTFFQHLSPLARYAAPHDETIIYVPSGAAVARSSASWSLEPARKQDAKQYEQISQQIEQIQGAIQQGSSAVGPQLSEAASAAAAAASNAGSGLFPALFPPAASGASLKEDKLKSDRIEYEATPVVATTSLLSAGGEGRRYYALTPAVSHVIDFVHAPVFVGPLSAVRSRSIQASERETERESEKLSDAIPVEDSLKAELPLIDIKEKKASETLKEVPIIEADRLKEENEKPEQREQRPDRKEDKLEVKTLEDKKLEEQRFEEKKLDDKKFEEKRIEEKKLDDSKFEEKKFEEKKTEEKKYEQKKLEEKKLEEKKIDEKFEEKQPQQKIATSEQKPQLIKQPLQQEEQKLNIPLLDNYQYLEKELDKTQQLPQQPIQERKEQPIQERKEESKDIQPQQQQQPYQEKELQQQQQQKQLIEASQQQQVQPQQQQQIEAQAVQQKELQPQLLQQQQQKQLQTLEKLEIKPIEEQKELKEKREELKESKKDELLQPEQEQLKKDSFKKESVKSAEPELNKIISEPEKDQKPLQEKQQQFSQSQLQRVAGGRVEGTDVVSVHHAAHHQHHHEEPQQQQLKTVGVAPVEPSIAVPVFVPQTKAV